MNYNEVIWKKVNPCAIPEKTFTNCNQSAYTVSPTNHQLYVQTHMHNKRGIMSSPYTQTHSQLKQSPHRFIFYFFIFNFAAMATTICLRTLNAKSAQWFITRLWDYPIHTEKLTQSQRDTVHAHTHTGKLFLNYSVCGCVCVCDTVQYRHKREKKEKLKRSLLNYSYKTDLRREGANSY